LFSPVVKNQLKTPNHTFLELILMARPIGEKARQFILFLSSHCIPKHWSECHCASTAFHNQA
jgi:hypothetical protein